MRSLKFIFLFLISIFANNCFADLGYEFCMFKASEFKEVLQFPVNIDDITVLEDISCEESVPSRFQYRYLLKGSFNNEDKIALDNFLKNNLSQQLNQTWCDKKTTYYEMVRFMDIEFIYKDKNNNLISKHKITLKNCSNIKN